MDIIKKRSEYVLLIGLIIIAGIVFFFMSPVTVQSPKAVIMRGEVVQLGFNTATITIKDSEGEEKQFSFLTNDTNFFDEENREGAINILPGFTIEAKGTLSANGTFEPSEIHTIKVPNIMVFSPRAHDAVHKTFMVSGKARVFENQFSIRIISSRGTLLREIAAIADAPDIGLFGNFGKEITLPDGLKDNVDLTLEVFTYSAKDGSEIDKVSLPLRYVK